MRRIILILACLAPPLNCLFAQADKAPEKKASTQVELFSHTLRTGIEAQPEIKLFLRLPKPIEAVRDNKKILPPIGSPKLSRGAKGVLIYCTWETDAESLQKFLRNDKAPLVKFAQAQNLAILTFDTATLWKSSVSTRDLSARERSIQDKRFERISRLWDRGVHALCRKHNLPQDGFLLYGFSRGSHYAHRLIVRLPERFAAAHLHVANSFELPDRKTGRVCWLITTGNLDRGFDESSLFYQTARQQNYPILFRSFFGLGHESDHRVTRLNLAFFSYIIELQKQSRKTGATPAEALRKDLSSASLVADAVNELVYPISRILEIPQKQRVPLPNNTLAKQWGPILKDRLDK